MPSEGLRLGRDSGSILCVTLKKWRFRTVWGGTSTLVKHMETGILVPTNAPFLIAANIKLLIEDVELAGRLGMVGKQTAIDRHNPEKIVCDLVQTINIIQKDK